MKQRCQPQSIVNMVCFNLVLHFCPLVDKIKTSQRCPYHSPQNLWMLLYIARWTLHMLLRLKFTRWEHHPGSSWLAQSSLGYLKAFQAGSKIEMWQWKKQQRDEDSGFWDEERGHRSWKGEENGFPPRASRKNTACSYLDFSTVKPLQNVWATKLKGNKCLVSCQYICGKWLKQQ